MESGAGLLKTLDSLFKDIYVTGYRKRAHFAQELIFQNKQLKYVTPLDFVHNSDSLKCYNFSQEDQFFML